MRRELTPAIRSQKRLALLVLVVVVMTSTWLAGCDTVGDGTGENIILPTKEVTFRYRFETTMAQGNSLTASADETFSLDNIITEGFSRSDVVRVDVISVELERIQPTNQFLNDFLTRANFNMISNNGSEQTVAAVGSFSATRSAELNVSAGDVTAITTGRDFTSELEMSVQQMTFDEYVIEVTAELRIEVADI